MTGVNELKPEVSQFVERCLDASLTIQPTHGRFSLRKNRDFLITEDSDPASRKRVLIAPKPKREQAMSRALGTAGISHFKLVEIFNIGAIYDVPIQAKPLSYESMHSQRPSSETYISDEELISRVASMWRSFSETIGSLPRSRPLRNVGLIDFGPKNVVPIPPYSMYAHVDLSQAKTHFIDSLATEVASLGEPQAVNAYVDIANASWEQSGDIAS